MLLLQVCIRAMPHRSALGVHLPTVNAVHPRSKQPCVTIDQHLPACLPLRYPPCQERLVITQHRVW